ELSSWQTCPSPPIMPDPCLFDYDCLIQSETRPRMPIKIPRRSRTTRVRSPFAMYCNFVRIHKTAADHACNGGEGDRAALGNGCGHAGSLGTEGRLMPEKSPPVANEPEHWRGRADEARA